MQVGEDLEHKLWKCRQQMAIDQEKSIVVSKCVVGDRARSMHLNRLKILWLRLNFVDL